MNPYYAAFKRYTKPTKGPRPRRLLDEERFHEIMAAINDRILYGQYIPLEWVEEYNEIIERLSK